VFRDELGKCDENGSLECRLTVVVHVKSAGSCKVDVLCGEGSGSLQAHKKCVLPVMANSNQLAANALALKIVRVMVMNLRVSRAPRDVRDSADGQGGARESIGAGGVRRGVR